MENSCNRTVQYSSGFDTRYYKCDKNPFKRVKYKSGLKKEEVVDEVLCKTHFNALVKNISRITKRTGFDFDLTVSYF